MEDPWNPERYHRFRDERRQPFLDLLALVEPAPGLRILDLGAGTGEGTALLHERLQAAATLGVDTSPAMLAQAAPLARHGLRFLAGDIGRLDGTGDVAAGAWDLVFSNAALHWIPDHAALLGRLSALLAPSGQLAVQVPANHRHPSQTVAQEVAREEPFRAALSGWVRQSPVLEPEDYADRLARLGFARQHVRLQVYTHPLAGPEEVVEWVRGTTLTDYERRLSPALFARFLERHRARLLAVLPAERPYWFHFRRILLWAART